jgi:hypothetical protein
MRFRNGVDFYAELAYAERMRKQTFTKRLALELLAVPPRDGLARPIGERDVSKIMRAMLGGWWKWDAAPPIRIGTDGACYDGRHRLTALSRLDKVEMKAWVDDDVDPGDFIYYDTTTAHRSGDDNAGRPHDVRRTDHGCGQLRQHPERQGVRQRTAPI